MKLAISNIAWGPLEDSEMLRVLQLEHIHGVEIAPTKMWPTPLEATRRELLEYRAFWEGGGLTIVALQALLYGRPELTIFESAEQRAMTLDYLRRIIDVGAELGAGRLVFGSPRHRRVGTLSTADALSIAVPFFAELGAHSAAAGVVLCIEPNAPQYGCDFVRTTAEAEELIRLVDSPGFGLHLDAGIMTLVGDAPDESISSTRDLLRHFHVSEPELKRIGLGGVEHEGFAAALRLAGYNEWVSIEMRPPAEGSGVPQVVDAIDVARRAYGTARSCG